MKDTCNQLSRTSTLVFNFCKSLKEFDFTNCLAGVFSEPPSGWYCCIRALTSTGGFFLAAGTGESAMINASGLRKNSDDS